jgi:hypothetical protein
MTLLVPLPPDYASWLAELKQQIHSALQRGARRVNRQLVQTCLLSGHIDVESIPS